MTVTEQPSYFFPEASRSLEDCIAKFSSHSALPAAPEPGVQRLQAWLGELAMLEQALTRLALLRNVVLHLIWQPATGCWSFMGDAQAAGELIVSTARPAGIDLKRRPLTYREVFPP